MDKPTKIEKIQLIAVMRVLDCSHDSIASTLHVHKEKVKQTEEWLRNEGIGIVYDVLADQALKRIVTRELPSSEEIDHTLLVRAAQVTREDILRHYDLTQKSKALNACLHIGAPSVDVYSDDIYVARYASVEVSAAKLEAKDCWAWVDIIPVGPSFPLHWAGTSYTPEETTAKRIRIRYERPARLDVAVALPPLDRASAALYPKALICGEVAFF